jgi:hypothetical protein
MDPLLVRLAGGGLMGKAAENERIKLRATFYNNVAVGLVITGMFVPYLTIIQSELPNFRIIFEAFRAGNPSQYEPPLVKLFAILLAFGSAAIFRLGANTEIAKLQD